ncbi:MAG: hypothetical protein AB7I50_03660 [Vicinamibacterales bacterium]
MPTLEMYLLGAGALLLVVQMIVAIVFVRALKRLRPIEDRVAQFGDALGLLTEAAESGFKATVGEIERLGGKMAHRTSSSPLARVTAAARAGADPKQIAARERLSEGEVNLCLSLADQGQAAERTPPRPSRSRRPKESSQRKWTPVGVEPAADQAPSE